MTTVGTGLEIRPPAPEELRAAMDAAEIAFGSVGVEDDDWERESNALPAARTLAAFDEGKPVGLVGAYAFDLSIPGGQLPCAGVTWVGVLPTHRRRGILRALVRRQLDVVRAWGEPIAALWASESSIYGRFGYGQAAANMHLKSDRARFDLRDDLAAGASVRLVDADEALRLFPPVYERERLRRPGMLSRDERWWREHRLADPESWRNGASKKFYAAVELDGEVEGYAFYRVKEEWQDGIARGEVRVVEAVAVTPGALRALWRFLHDLDLTARVEAHYFDPGSPLPLVVHDPRALGLRWGDGLWLRLVDVDAALRARSYRPGRPIVVEVRDEMCPWNSGRYRVGERAGATDGQPDLELDVSELASAYLGGVDLHRLLHAGLVEEHSEGAVEAASILFRTDVIPYCPEDF